MGKEEEFVKQMGKKARGKGGKLEHRTKAWRSRGCGERDRGRDRGRDRRRRLLGPAARA